MKIVLLTSGLLWVAGVLIWLAYKVTFEGFVSLTRNRIAFHWNLAGSVLGFICLATGTYNSDIDFFLTIVATAFCLLVTVAAKFNKL